MGGCQSSQGDAEFPKLPSSIILKKFNSVDKHVFEVPLTLAEKRELQTSNGKITDFVTKKIIPKEIQKNEEKVQKPLELKLQQQFQDKQFMRNQQSLGSHQYSQSIEWRRPNQFMKVAEDIRQGRLNDSYLISAFVAINQYPFIIKRILEHTQITKNGCYGVWLFIDGFWRSIKIDDYFPVSAGKPFFTRNHENQLWVMLIEKAYAKIFKSYQAIETGLTGVALNALTGAPFEYLNKDSNSQLDPDVAWNFITLHVTSNHIVIGSTQSNDRNGYLSLASVHAYTIIDIQEVYIATNKGKKKERILKISNPWGKYEWKGRWSEYSDVWSEQLRRTLRFEKAQDDIFWISIQDYVCQFKQICACKYNKNYINTSLAMKFSPQEQNEFKGVFLRVSNRNEGYLSLIQKDHRAFSKLYEYSITRMIIIRMDSFGKTLHQYVNDIFDCDQNVSVKVELDPGDYYILIEVDWKCSFTRDIVLNFYGEQPVNMVEDPKSINIENIFAEIVFLHQKFTQKDRIYEYPKDNKIRRISGSIAGYVYYHYINHSKNNNYLCETVRLEQRKWIDVIGQPSKQEFTARIMPDQQKIIRLRVLKEGNSYHSYSTKIQFFVVQKYTKEKLKELVEKKATKIKKREVEGKQIEVKVKTFHYSGGVVLLYQNAMDKYAYIEEITFEIENLELEDEELKISQQKKLEIQLEPRSEKMLSFVVVSPGKQVVFKTKMSFYLSTPEFKF